MISFTNGIYLLCNEEFFIIVSKGNSSKNIPHYLLVIQIGDSVIIKNFRRLSSLRSFALEILHIFGFTDLTVDIFHHPEEYFN